MHLGKEQLEVILDHARWVEWQVSEIAEAHALGHGPGEHTDLDSEELRCQAREVYELTLPPHCLRLIAESFCHCADVMTLVRPDPWVAEEWATVISYLRSAPGQPADNSGVSPPSTPFSICEFSNCTLELVRYEELAKLMHPKLVEKLYDAATAIVQYCRFDSLFAPDDFQRTCLQRLANGDHYEDIAVHMGYSKRQIQRKLTDLWNQLGVDNPTQGLAMAVEQGWVTIPRDTNQ